VKLWVQLLLKLESNVITSSKIINLIETYVSSKNISNHNVEVYVNPTFDELVTIKNYYKDVLDRGEKIIYRYLADAKKQKIFVAAAYDAIHRDIRQMTGYPIDAFTTPYLLNGEAELKGRKLVPSWPYSNTQTAALSDYKHYKEEGAFLKVAIEYNWSWLDNYISGVSKDLNQVKREFIQLQKAS
jgi:hypothetical protein